MGDRARAGLTGPVSRAPGPMPCRGAAGAPFQKRPQAVAAGRKAVRPAPARLPPPGPSRRVMRPQLPQEPIGIAPLDPFGGQDAAREIGAVEGDDRLGPARDGGGQDVDIVLIGQMQARFEPLVGRRCWPWGRPRAPAPLSPRASASSAAPWRAAARRPFLQDAVGPQRREKPRPRRAQQDLAQDGGVEHAGVKHRLHPSSRKNSALR